MGISQYPFGSQGNLRRKRNCLHEIATAPLGPRNDKPLAFTVLSAACTGRQYRAGSGMPLPYNGRCMHRERPQICGLYTVRRGRRTLQHAIDTSTISPQKCSLVFWRLQFFIGRIGENARFRRAFSAPAAGAARAWKAQTPPSEVGMMSYCQTIYGRSAQNLARFLEHFYEIDFVVIQSVDIPVSSGV